MKKQAGLTLIEILISLALGLFLIAGTLGIYINTISGSAYILKSVRLNYDLDMAMNLMINDIRRAGHLGTARIDNPNGFNNRFTQNVAGASSNLRIGNAITTEDCILYTYDANLGVTGTADGNGLVDANEYYGFRRYYNAETDTYTIQMRLSGTTTDDCNDGEWQSITDENMIDITEMRFSFASLDTATGNSPCANPAAATCLAATSRCITSINATAANPNPPTYTSTTLTNAGICTSFVDSNNAAAANPPPATKIGQKRIVNIHLSARLRSDFDVVKSLNSSVKVANDRLCRFGTTC